MSSQFSSKVIRIRLIDGIEQDWLTGYRRWLARNRAGRNVLKFVKRAYNKRVRRKVRMEIARALEE